MKKIIITLCMIGNLLIHQTVYGSFRSPAPIDVSQNDLKKQRASFNRFLLKSKLEKLILIHQLVLLKTATPEKNINLIDLKTT